MRMVTSNQVLHFWWDWRELRGHIIEELYVLLRRLGINSKLIVTWLALLQDLLKIHQEMLEGVASFGKAAANQLRSDLRWNQKPGPFFFEYQAPIWLAPASSPGDNDPVDQNRLKA